MEKFIEIAKKASEHAYCPHSGYSVGACLVCQDRNRWYTGCNIENSSFGATLCAERVAFVKALSEGERFFSELIIYARNFSPDSHTLPYPCGMCLQFMSEFVDQNFEITVVGTGPDGDVTESFTFKDLMPRTFSFSKEDKNG